jgi:hypothetical protein
MKILKTLLILTVLVLVKNDSAKAYYFQLQDLKDSIIFKYECKEDASKTEYWKLTSKHNTLITEAYTSDIEKYEFFVEEFTKNGSKVLKFISYHKNEDGAIEVINRKLKDSDVYRWEKAEDYHYSTEFVDPKYGKITFSKHRTFAKEAVIHILGANHQALKFKGTYRTKIPDDNYDYQYEQFSYYAKGLGLVKMEKTYPDGEKVTLELTEIITKDAWDKMQ